MFLIDQKNLARMWDEKEGKVKVELHQIVYKDAVGWEAHILTSDGQARLVNTRGEIRYWRQLNSAAKELSDFLPRLPSFLVVLAGENNRILNIEEIDHGETR